MNFQLPDFNDQRHVYLQIADIIEQKIILKKIKVGDKLPPEEDLCKMLNVSVITVRGALEKLKEKGYVVRRRNLGTVVVSSKPNMESSSIRGKEITILGCATGMSNRASDPAIHPYHLRVFRGIFDAAQEKDLSLKYFKIADETDMLTDNKFKKSIGIIGFGDITEGHIRAFKKSRVPFVLAGDAMMKEILDDVDIVANDSFGGGYLAAKHLLGLGHKKILYAGAFFKNSWEIEEFNGFLKAHDEAGVPLDKKSQVVEVRYSEEFGSDAKIKELFKKPSFTAVICNTCSSEIAGEIKKNGMTIPADISMLTITSMGDIINMYDPGMTIVASKPTELGKAVLERLVGKILDSERKPERTIIPNELIIKNSTKVLNMPVLN